jgi:hypothetical protein
MNCQKSREAIEMRLNREAMPVSLAAHFDQCVDCQAHARETASLFSLLKSLPPVEAPADFDFRLRARIARARSEQESVATPAAWFNRLWSGSFSWVQATTAMAAVAAIVSLSSYQFNQQNQSQPTPSSAAVATVAGETAGLASSNQAGANGQLSARAEAAPALKNASTRTRVSTESPVAPVATLAANVDVAADSASEKFEAGSNGMRIFNHEQGRMISASQQMTLIGAEGSSANTRQAGFVPSI